MALLEAGADPNARGEHSAFPLLIAARYGTGEVVAALLDGGGRIWKCAKKTVPLHCIARQGAARSRPS